MSKQQSFDQTFNFSQDQAVLASLALPRNPLAGAIFAGHHLWWKGNDVVEELARVENEAVPKKASFLQYGTSSSLSNLSQGLHAEVAWNSGETLGKHDMYLGLKTINNKIDDDNQYFKTIFSATIPRIDKAATESLETSGKLLEAYIGREQETAMVKKTLGKIDDVEKEENELLKAYWEKEAIELGILTDAQNAVIKAYASLQNYDKELTEFFSPTLIEEEEEIDAGKVTFAEVDLKEYKEQLDVYKTTISDLKKQIKKMGIAERALEEEVCNLKDQLITADQSHLKILAKRKQLSERYAAYVKASRTRMATEREKIRKQEKAIAEKAAKAAAIHANGLENLLKACEARVTALKSKQNKGTEEAKRTMQHLLDEVEKKVEEKEKSNEELEKQNKLLTQEAGEAQRFAKIKEKKAEKARLESQETIKNMELKLNEEKTKAEKEVEENKALKSKNILLKKMTTQLQKLATKDKQEIAEERTRYRKMVETLTLGNKKLNEEAEAAATEDKEQDALTGKKEEAIELLVEQINIIPAPTSIISKPKHGPLTAKIIPKNWIFPKTKQDAIESVFNLDENLKTVVMNQSIIKENINKFTMWSLLYDGVGLEQDFSDKQLPQNIYRDPPLESIIPGVKSPTSRDTIRATSDTAPAIFYAPKGDIKIQILVPSRFILAKDKKPKGATGPHVLIGFSVYLQILKADDSVSSFFMNLELKHNNVEKNLIAKTFSPTKSVMEIAESGLTGTVEGELATSEVAYFGNQQNILKTIQSSGTWKDVRGHVTRVYLHGNATKPIKEWTAFRKDQLIHSNKKFYGHIEDNFKQWLTDNEEHLSFVTTTNIVGTPLTAAIETKLPSDSGKWLRQTSFTATPEFW